ncbi:YceD family protein [Pseudooceanicola algae]|uniref:DUF177 domain-containing protein n=1 Tax=Pseudooceanicola algae TaxID=1537215 RepID=A0A418SDN0_9RHOB|nr:DUF177 domain-containing protein [Pseudooceanicola algae]QPM89465.1 hypothetical protein PSAL_006850 [Pseudooceanicola algae]
MTGPDPDSSATTLRVSTLSKTRPTTFELRPDKAVMAQIAARLDLDDLRKLSFRGEITAEGRDDWVLKGHLGATVVQPCSVTLVPVSTRLEEAVLRRFTPHLADDVNEDEESEMPEDESLEPLGAWIDPAQVMEEALSLALPMYPRAEGVGPADAVFAEPGQKPMTDEDAKPFAGLAGLMAGKGLATPDTAADNKNAATQDPEAGEEGDDPAGS